MILTQHNIASATPRNRGRLAKALGLAPDASIAALVAACNAHSACNFACSGYGGLCRQCRESLRRRP